MPQAALDLVLALFRDPGLVAEFRERALPGDIGQVIRIAACVLFVVLGLITLYQPVLALFAQ